MVAFSRVAAGKVLTEVTDWLAETLKGASSEASLHTVQGLTLCLLTDYAVGAPKTDHNAVCFAQNVQRLLEISTERTNPETGFTSALLELSDRYLSLPIEYIDPGSEDFKQYIRYLLSELETATDFRAALLTDKILAGYLDMWEVSKCREGLATCNDVQVGTMVLTLLYFTKAVFQNGMLSMHRMAYILELIEGLLRGVCSEHAQCYYTTNVKLAKGLRRVVTHAAFSPSVDKKEYRKLRKTVSSTIKRMVRSTKRQFRRNRLRVDKSLCHFPSHGSIPLSGYTSAKPVFAQSVNIFTQSRQVLAAVTRPTGVSIGTSFSCTGCNTSKLTIKCTNIIQFIDSSSFYTAFTAHFAFPKEISLKLVEYTIDHTQAYTALIEAEAANVEESREQSFLEQAIETLKRALMFVLMNMTVAVTVTVTIPALHKNHSLTASDTVCPCRC